MAARNRMGVAVTTLEAIADALRIAAEHDRGYAFFPDDLAASVRSLVYWNVELGRLADDYNALAYAQAGLR
jgi:hypothetical protein